MLHTASQPDGTFKFRQSEGTICKLHFKLSLARSVLVRQRNTRNILWERTLIEEVRNNGTKRGETTEGRKKKGKKEIKRKEERRKERNKEERKIQI
jgi:hypothetical protein